MVVKYLAMVSQLQWLVTMGRFDLHAYVATMSRFRAASRQGHMHRLIRINAYAIRMKDYAIRFRTDQPDYSFLPMQDFDWAYSVYGDVHKVLPDDMPESLGGAVTTTTTMDANFEPLFRYWQISSWMSPLCQQTHEECNSKKHATVETATYGFAATEQMMDIGQTLRYLGAPICS